MSPSFCIECKHFSSKSSCKAFPEKIPIKIIVGEKEHNKVLKDQKGKFIFEPL